MLNKHAPVCGTVRSSHQLWAVVLDQNARSILRCEYTCYLPEDLEEVFTHLDRFAEIYGARLRLALCNLYGNGELFDPTDSDYKAIFKISEDTLRSTDLPGNRRNDSTPYADPTLVAVIVSITVAQQLEKATTFVPKTLAHSNSDCPF